MRQYAIGWSRLSSSMHFAMLHPSSFAPAGYSRVLTSSAAVLQLRDKSLPPLTFLSSPPGRQR